MANGRMEAKRRCRSWRLFCVAIALSGTLHAQSDEIVAPAVVAPAAEAATGSQASPSQERPFLGGFLKETRVVYPLRIGRWTAEGETLYEDPRLGASVRYRDPAHDDRWLDVYFYPAGVLPAGQLDIDMRATLDELLALAGQTGYYAQMEAGEVGTFPIDLKQSRDVPRVPALSTDLLQVRDTGKPYHSAIVLLSHQLYYIKARYSVEADAMSRHKVRRQLERFVTGLVRETGIASTGECWMPLPIEPIARGAPAPEDTGMSMTDEDDAAYVLPDRVLATDPEGSTAKLMQVLGMVQTGRWFDGCVGADPVNPEVPEGKRELRFEYRAPSGDDDTRPSRGDRPGARTV